ncbi:MAG: tetratricopeptide repeat protein [Candidatus Kariarchaeaceae archaeon]|jgi:tetratricopeptide (TPR) repeat protein
MSFKGTAYWQINDLDNAISSFNKSLEISNSIEDKELVGYALNNLGRIEYEKGEYSKAQEFFEESFNLANSLNRKSLLSLVLDNLASTYSKLGRIGEALELINTAFSIAEAINDQQRIVSSQILMGELYQNKGDLNTALNWFYKALEKIENAKNQSMLYRVYYHLADIYRIKGEYDTALQYLESCLKLKNVMQSNRIIGDSLISVGIIYQSRGDLQLASKYFDRALKDADIRHNQVDKSKALLNLVRVSLNMEMEEKAEKYLQKLEMIRNHIENKYITQNALLAQALILKNSTRISKRAKAMEIFTLIEEDEVIDHEIVAASMLNKCELLLEELRVYGEKEVFDELFELTNKLIAFGKSIQSFSILAETYLLQSKLFLLEGNLIESQQMLADALEIADQNGLHQLALRISNEYDLILDKLEDLEKIFSISDTSIQERVQTSGINEFINELIHRKPQELKVKNELPVFLIILAETGISLYAKQFIEERQIIDALLASFISAINTFLGEIFSETGFINRIKYGKYTIILKRVSPLIFCYGFEGPSYASTKRIEEFVSSLHESIIEDLENHFQGLSTENKAHLDKLVKRIFEF